MLPPPISDRYRYRERNSTLTFSICVAGNWSKILKDDKFNDHLKGREPRALAEKWNTLNPKTGKSPAKAKSPVKTPAKKVPTQKQEEITSVEERGGSLSDSGTMYHQPSHQTRAPGGHAVRMQQGAYVNPESSQGKITANTTDGGNKKGKVKRRTGGMSGLLPSSTPVRRPGGHAVRMQQGAYVNPESSQSKITANTTDGGNKKGKVKRPRGDAVPRKDAELQEENATPATNQESQNTHQRSDKRPRTDSKVGEEEEEESYEAAMKQISSISGEQRAKLSADMKKKLKDAETTQAKREKGDLINQLKKCRQDVDKITVFFKLGERREKAIATVKLFEQNLKDRKVGKGMLNELRNSSPGQPPAPTARKSPTMKIVDTSLSDAKAFFADVQKEYEVEHQKMTRAFESLPDKSMLNQKKEAMNNLIKAINDLPISHTYKQAADYLERHRLVDAGKWHFVKHLRSSGDHAPAKGYGSWFDFWAKVTGKDGEKGTPICCAAEGCDETMKVTKNKLDEHFKAKDFDGCHVLIARGQKELNNWTYEEKVAIVPACGKHNTHTSKAKLIMKETDAAVIPPLFGEIPRLKPDKNVQARRQNLPTKPTHWKTLALIDVGKNKGTDGNYKAGVHTLTLRGEDNAEKPKGPYTWNSERLAKVRDEDTQPAHNKIFGDFVLEVKDDDFMYKYLAPMHHTSIFDEGPREVRRNIFLNGKCEEGEGREWHRLTPWVSHNGKRSPPN